MSDVQKAGEQAATSPKTRNRPVKPGHLEIGEFTSGVMGASSPFGRSHFPLPVSQIHYEHPETVPERLLDDERH
ncbi:MAG TPA: hypothetical protein VFU12_11955 [Glycomyces sp.]|nr:hypothetical protein [Glycomyces sp.]